MLEVGDRVKLILDKEQGPDTKWHGKIGTVRQIMADSAGEVTGDPMDSLLFEIELDSGEVPDVHFRWADIVPLEEYPEDLGIEHPQQ